MISRRNFLSGAGALAFTPLIRQVVGHYERFEQPLLIKPDNPKRVFYMHEIEGRGYRIVTDALDFPRKHVRTEVLKKHFGYPTYQYVKGTDQWMFIDRGVFRGDDLYQPTSTDWHFRKWLYQYAPRVEAHWLLKDYGLGPEACDDNKIGLQLALSEET